MSKIKNFMEGKVLELKSLKYAFGKDYEVMKQKYPGVYCMYTPNFKFFEQKIFIDTTTVNDMFPKLIKPVSIEVDGEGAIIKYDYIHGFQGGYGETMSYQETDKLQECDDALVNEIITKLNSTLGKTLDDYNKFSGVKGE